MTKTLDRRGKDVRLSKILTLLAVGLALGSSGCAAVDAARSAEVEKQKTFEQRVDTAHIWVTTQPAPAGKPYSTLGELNYTVPFSPDAIDEAQITDKLKKIALQKWPDTIDAIVDENQTVSADGSQITVTGKAIQYDSSVDRTALRHLNDNLVASPNDNQ